MQNRNGSKWGNGFAVVKDADAVVADEDHEDRGRGAHGDGWQQYRRWISKAPAPKQRRSGIDSSLYTWKGYRSWTEQIKRSWPDKA